MECSLGMWARDASFTGLNIWLQFWLLRTPCATHYLTSVQNHTIGTEGGLSYHTQCSKDMGFCSPPQATGTLIWLIDVNTRAALLYCTKLWVQLVFMGILFYKHTRLQASTSDTQCGVGSLSTAFYLLLFQLFLPLPHLLPHQAGQIYSGHE